MRTIYKYPLPLPVIGDEIIIEAPIRRILLVNVQRNQLYLWAEVDTDRPALRHHFRIVGTGHELTFPTDCPIGSVLSDEGKFVWHVFYLGTSGRCPQDENPRGSGRPRRRGVQNDSV